MKRNHLVYALALLALTSCNSHRNDNVVCETYVHRYGVELPPEDWSDRGQHGQVVSTMKDGVVVSRNYDSGVLHGETTYTYPHRETIQRKELYAQGSLSQQSWTYSNGLPYKQINHLSPTSQELVIWYENGAPQCREIYDNNLLVSGDYFTADNLEESSVRLMNGTRIRRDRYGEMESVDEIQNGQMTSRTTYHSNGTPESLTPFVNDKVHGQKKTFLPGGEPNTIEEWNNNFQHGNTIVFENGEKVSDTPYVYGRRHGVETCYSQDGQTVIEQSKWAQGTRHGPCCRYVGNVKRTDWYFQGKPVNKPTYDALCNQ